MSAAGNRIGRHLEAESPRHWRPLLTQITTLSLASLAALAIGCGKEKAQAPPAVPVLAAEAVLMDVPITVDAIGTVEAFNTVSVAPRVSGQILEVGFSEGQDVARGALLFRIDPAPYEAALAQASANLERDRAKQIDAEAELARYTDLVSKQLVAEQEYGSAAATAAGALATVKADSAALELARLNLGYCTIRAPIAGRTGRVLVQQGNLVTAGGGSTLVTINQVVPISVAFSIPEQRLPEVRRYSGEGTLAVRAFLASDSARIDDGRLAFINNTVDVATGTIELKATFPNENRALWPGQFVRVRLLLTTQMGAVVVPTTAVETSQQGHYVYVIKPDDTVEMRTVVTGTKTDDTIVLETGVQPGERVVTDGQLRLRPGAKAVIKSGLEPAASAARVGEAAPAGRGGPQGAPGK